MTQPNRAAGPGQGLRRLWGQKHRQRRKAFQTGAWPFGGVTRFVGWGEGSLGLRGWWEPVSSRG